MSPALHSLRKLLKISAEATGGVTLSDGRYLPPKLVTEQRINNTYRGQPPPGKPAPQLGPGALLPPLFERAVYNDDGVGMLKQPRAGLPTSRASERPRMEPYLRAPAIAEAAGLPWSPVDTWSNASVVFTPGQPRQMQLATDMPRRMAYHELTHAFDPAVMTLTSHEPEIPAMVVENNAARMSGWVPTHEDWVQAAMKKYGPKFTNNLTTDSQRIRNFVQDLRADTPLGRSYVNYLAAQASP